MTTKGYERFSADLAEFANTLGIELDKAIRKVSLDVFTGIVKKTPVDKGALRANWAIGVNKEVTKRPLDKGVKLSAGAAESAAMKDVSHLSKVKAGDRVIISNNMPYARVVEYGEIKGDGPKTVGGYSKQAPRGMVRVTLAEVEGEMACDAEFTAMMDLPKE